MHILIGISVKFGLWSPAFGTRFLLKRLSDKYYNMQPQTGCTISENNGYDHLFSSSLIDFCNLFEHSAIETFFAHLLAFICECIFFLFAVSAFFLVPHFLGALHSNYDKCGSTFLAN
jgi:hypothetical protein